MHMHMLSCVFDYGLAHFYIYCSYIFQIGQKLLLLYLIKLMVYSNYKNTLKVYKILKYIKKMENIYVYTGLLGNKIRFRIL